MSGSRAVRRHVLALALVGIVVTAGCAPNSDRSATDNGSAVFVTTTLQATNASSTTPTSAATRSSTTGAPTTAPPSTTTTTTTTTTAVPPTIPGGVGDPIVALEPIGEFDRPVGVAVRPGDDALWVIEQRGRIVRMVDSGERFTALEIPDELSDGGEQGLLGLAFSPTAPLAYTYSTDTDGDSLVSEYPVDDDGAFDAGRRRTILTIDQPFDNHNGGELVFGPDGYLYISTGDGGSANDPERNASDPTSLLGAILRIDPSVTDGAAYDIPADNPFVTGSFEGTEGAPEVWAWGLRNPWRLAFDAATGDLWIADVGQAQYEEVNRVSPTDTHAAGFAANFGWSAFEGTERVNEDVADPGNLVSPILVYEHGDDGCSVSGGAVYRGRAIPELVSGYVYADYCSGKMWVIDIATERNIMLLDGLDGPTAIREGPDGEIFVLEIGGTVSRVVSEREPLTD